MEYLLCAKHWAKCFTYFDTFNPNDSPMNYMLPYYPNFTNKGEKSPVNWVAYPVLDS